MVKKKQVDEIIIHRGTGKNESGERLDKVQNRADRADKHLMPTDLQGGEESAFRWRLNPSYQWPEPSEESLTLDPNVMSRHDEHRLSEEKPESREAKANILELVRRVSEARRNRLAFQRKTDP
jgi:hypothetical protein